MKSFGRVIVAASAAVAFTAGSAFVAPVVGANPLGSLGSGSLGSLGDNCGEKVVTSLKDSGWGTPTDETPADLKKLEKPTEKQGASAVAFPDEDTQGKPGASLYKSVDLPIATLLKDDKPIALSYDYTASGQAPALQIRLNNANVEKSGNEKQFATIVWSPVNSDGAWKTAKPGSDAAEFWMTKPILGVSDGEGTQGKKTTLKRLVELNKNAKIVEYGVQRTQENNSTNAAFDNFTFGCEVTKFELPANDGPLGSLTNIFGS